MEKRSSGLNRVLSRVLVPVLAAICVCIMTGCGSAAKYDSSSDAAVYMPMPEEAAEAESGYIESPAASPADNVSWDNSSGNSGTSKSERKLIKTINITCETLNFDDFFRYVEQQTESMGGYIESSSSYGIEGSRSGSLTIRVPNNRTQEMENNVDQNANIVSRNAYSEDVTLQYSDLAAHISALRTEQKTLENMLSQAEDIETLLAIQNELSNVRYEIESYESSMNILENRIDYDTIYLTINEVRSESAAVQEGFWDRVKARFTRSNINLLESLEDLAIWFLGNIITILIVAVIVVVLIVIIKAFGRSSKRTARAQARKELKENKRQAQKELKENKRQAQKKLQENKRQAQKELQENRLQAQKELQENRLQAQKELQENNTKDQ